MEIDGKKYIKVINDQAHESGWAFRNRQGELILDNTLGRLKPGDRIKIDSHGIIAQVKTHHYEFGELITSDWQPIERIERSNYNG